MYDIPARPDVVLDHAGHRRVCDQPSKHRWSQHSRELSRPNEDDRDHREGGGSNGTDDIDVAGGCVQNTVP